MSNLENVQQNVHKCRLHPNRRMRGHIDYAFLGRKFHVLVYACLSLIDLLSSMVAAQLFSWQLDEFLEQSGLSNQHRHILALRKGTANQLIALRLVRKSIPVVGDFRLLSAIWSRWPDDHDDLTLVI